MADVTEESPYQSLYRRFRPSTFAEVRGQDHVVLALRNAVRDGRVAHAYLFSGPRGTGKTSTARILAKALNCTDVHDGEPCGVCTSCVEITRGTSMDVHELDAASNNGVDAMRDLVARAALGSPGRQKVYIVDEVHMLSTAASNALLKTLEEPPAHVVFVLATTDPQKVLPTIRSRTQHFEFRLLGPDTLSALLDHVRAGAQLDVGDDALDLAVRRARGSARDALSVLDQVVASEQVDDDLPELDEVVEALADRDVGRALKAVAHLTAAGFSPQQLTVDLVDHLRQGFLSLVAPELVTVAGAEREALAAQAGRVGLAGLVRAVEDLGRAQVSMRDAPDPRVHLEVALVRLTHPEADDSPAALLARIERLEQSGGTSAETAAAPARHESSHPSPTGAALAARAVAVPAGRSTAPAPADAAQTVAALTVAAPTADEQVAKQAGVRPTLGALRRQASGVTNPPDGSPGEPDPAVAPDRPAETSPTEPVAHPSEISPSRGPADPFPTRDELVQAWGDHVISRLRPKAKALFQAGRFVAVDAGRARFGLPNETHRNRCEPMREEVETALAEQFGGSVPLDLVVDETPGTAPSPRAPDDKVRSSRTPETSPAESGVPVGDDSPDSIDFDTDELEVADVDNSAQNRLLQAFPGAEEVV